MFRLCLVSSLLVSLAGTPGSDLGVHGSGFGVGSSGFGLNTEHLTLDTGARILQPSTSNLQPGRWTHISSKTGEIPVPNGGAQQTACVVFDIDGDGVKDIVIAERTQAPAVIWLRRTRNGWTKHVIDDTKQRPEAGGVPMDVDRDRDLDLILGGDGGSSELWWYENPAPRFDPAVPWVRHLIKSQGGRAHHDQVVGDFNGTGQPQLVFWNQGASRLFLADVPAEPRKATSWPIVEMFSHADQASGPKQEGASAFDVDGDGRLDILAGRWWFKHIGGDRFRPVTVAPSGGRIAAGRFKDGRTPQIVVAPGDETGPLMLYECNGDPLTPGDWVGRKLLHRDVVHGHSLELADINSDGNLDIFCAEMAKWTDGNLQPDHPHAQAWVLYGNGKGDFRIEVLATGFGFHEARVADADGDGRLDIISKPYNWEAPRLDIWLQRAM